MNPYIICPTQSEHEVFDGDDVDGVDYGIYIPRGLTAAPKFGWHSYVVVKPDAVIENPRSSGDYINHKVPLVVEDSYFDEVVQIWYYTVLLQCARDFEDAYPDWYYCWNPEFALVELKNISEDKLTFYAKNREQAQKKYEP